MIPESFQRNNGIFKNFRYADNRDGEPPEILRRRRFVARSKIHGFSDGNALSALREACEVDLYTDSRYVCDAVEKGWLAGWQKRHWVKSDKKPVLNVDLWKQLLPLLRTHNVTFHWLRGHAGHRENERCDELARAFAAGPDLPEDTGFTAAQA